MTFLNPILLSAGLACVALPILIHILMRRRRRPIAWGAMKFLLEAYRQQRKRLKLEQILLLSSRCLLVALLAMALGKPILGAAGLLDQRGPRTLYLLIDNGLASSVIDQENRQAIERHKNTAKELLEQLDQSRGDRAAIISLGSPADELVFPPTPDIPGALAMLKEMRPTDSGTDLASALARVRDDLTSADAEPIIAVLSDFRVGSAETDTTLPVVAGKQQPRLFATRPAVSPLDNFSVSSIEPLQSVLVASSEHPNSTPVRVELRRSGPGVGRAAVSKVRIEVLSVGASNALPQGKQHGSERTIAWTPGQETLTTTSGVELPSLTAARNGLIVRASIDRDSIEADNAYDRPIEVRERLNVVLVAATRGGDAGSIDRYSPSEWMSLALEPSDDGSLAARRAGDVRLMFIDPTRELADPRQASGPGPLTGADAVVVPYPHLIDANGWKRLRAAADSGSLVLVSPSPAENVHTWVDSFVDSMSLDWVIAREHRVADPPLTILPERPQFSGPDLLSLIASELQELVKPVQIFKNLPVRTHPGSTESLLLLSDGSPLLLHAVPGQRSRAPNTQPTSRGTVALLAVAPELSWTDLPAKPLMVPVIQELVRQSVGRASGSRVAVAGSNPLLPSGVSELVRHLSRSEARGDAASEILTIDSAGRSGAPIRHSSVWQARTAGGLSAGLLAVNPDTSAARIDIRGEDDIAKWLGATTPKFAWIGSETDEAGSSTQAAAVLKQEDQRPPISFPLLLAAACVAVIELSLARFFSHAFAT